MNSWFFSAEPDDYPWQKVEKETKVRWDGVRGTAAQKYMRAIKPGDLILAYHSAPQKAVVGVAKAVSQPYPDPKALKEEKDKWHVVDIVWDHGFPNPVSLARMRAEPTLSKMKFLIMPRLSISPVTAAEWKAIEKMGLK